MGTCERDFCQSRQAVMLVRSGGEGVCLSVCASEGTVGCGWRVRGKRDREGGLNG